jgi:hypothetical protein
MSEPAKTLENALAILISSTRARTRTRSLVELSDWLDVAVRHLGSVRAVADRIGLSPDMLRQFLSVRRLHPSVMELFARRELDSVDAATHLSRLSFDDQPFVADLLQRRQIDTSDVRAIQQLRKSSTSVSIGDLVSNVRTSRTTQEYVVDFVVRGSQEPLKVEGAIRQVFPSDQIVTLQLNGALGRLVLTKEGRRTLSASARRLRVPVKTVMNSILQNR